MAEPRCTECCIATKPNDGRGHCTICRNEDDEDDVGCFCRKHIVTCADCQDSFCTRDHKDEICWKCTKQNGSATCFNCCDEGHTKKKAPKPKAEPAPPAPIVIEQIEWACCDACGKWRKLPGNVDPETLPEQWFCSMNEWDSAHADCSVPEEPSTVPVPEAAPAHAAQGTKRGREEEEEEDDDSEDDE